ncbi:MT-A70-domain-containing protein [Abortiporus biennis]|nr:MT-A70-domain-containing protein [Abortiporus biennis]
MSVTTVQECLASANDLLASHAALLSQSRASQKSRQEEYRSLSSPPKHLLNISLIPSPPPSPPQSAPSSPSLPAKPKPQRPDLPPAKRARLARYNNYVPEEETIRNDYSQRYVDGGEWPQDWVLGADPEHRFEEYPKQQRLLSLKKQAVNEYALPPTYLPYSQLSTLSPSKFDVIIIDPPFSSSFAWDDLQDLPIPSLAADPSFVLMWVGSGAGEGLERGREIMAKWGFRRCEDIVWVKTNKTTNRGPGTDPPTTSLLTRTKQHCLMGIRGTVRRSSDSWFVHCNVDTDVMIWEGDPSDPTLKPPEMFTLIENFCLGLRRLEIFGRAKTLRRGWVTALLEGEEDHIPLDGDTIMKTETEQTSSSDNNESPSRSSSKGDGDSDRGGGLPVRWNREAWEAKIKELAKGGKLVVHMSTEIDALRPKSPVRGGSGGGSSNLNNNPNVGNNSLPPNPTLVASSMNIGGGGPNPRPNNRVMMGPPPTPMNMASMGMTPGGGGPMDPSMNLMPWSEMGGGPGPIPNLGGGGMPNIGMPNNAMGNIQRMNMNMGGMGGPMNIQQQQSRMGGGGGGGFQGQGGIFMDGTQQIQIPNMNMGGPHHHPPGMGWDQGQFGGGGGIGWGGGDPGMMGMNGMNMMNIPGGMNAMGLNVGMGMGMQGGMGTGMGMNGMMGMGGQWPGPGSADGFDGFRRQ